MARVITRLNIGGPARQALLLTKELAHDWPTTLIAGSPGGSEGELRDPAVTIHRAPLVRPVQPIADARALQRVRGILARERPDIVHTHMAKAGMVGRTAARSVRPMPRTVHTFHGHVLDGYFSRSVESAFIRVERALARRSDALVAVSDEVMNSLLELGIGTEDQYRVIPLGFDLSAFLDQGQPRGGFRADLGLGADTPLIAIVGRLVPIKDHTTLLDALQRLPEVHLAIVGDGELRSELEADVHARRLADRVHFTGWWKEIWRVYPDVDAVVLSSRNEGSPVALIEAHASGVPVVATDVGGVRSVVTDRESGYLVPPRQPDALAQAIETLLSDPSRAAAMGRSGREHVRVRFAQERLIADIRALYAELI